MVEGNAAGQSYTVALDHPALGGGDGNDQRTGKQRPGRGPVQPDLYHQQLEQPADGDG